MAETKKEDVIKDITQEAIQEPKVEEKKSEDKITVKKKPSMKKLNQDDDIIKVDLTKSAKVEDKVEDETEENTIESVIEEVEEKVEEKAEEEVKEQPVIEEITTEDEKEIKEVEEEIVKVVEEAEATGKPLPENIQKLMDFMEETGGDLQDYVKLNQDISKLNDNDVLLEYYKQTKPHLTSDEINFLMEDQFSYDEEEDVERDIKRKKLALKEQVASARAHLDGQKSKYYEEIKAGSKLTPEQQKAMDFFNRYNEESKENKKTYEQQNSAFLKQTDQVFNNKFKGFEYNVGDKKYRFNVKNPDNVKQSQSDINNFVKKFLNKNNVMQDAKGYHKSLFTAMNADAVAKHFYEQGKTDAVKNSISKAKNVDMEPRQSFGNIENSGMKVRVLGNDSNDFKFKIKNKR